MPLARKLTRSPHEALLSDLDLHVLLVDPAGRIIYANPRAETALAAQPGGLKSLMIDTLFSLRNPQWLSHEIRKCASEGQWAGEVVLNRHDGTECWAHVQACKCPKALGLSDSLLVEFEDITGNIELMTTLMKRNEDLFQRNRELEVVSKVGRLLLADTDLEYRLSAMLREAAKTIGVSCGVVWVKSRDGRELVVRSTYGLGTSILVNKAKTGVNEPSLAARTIATGRPQTVEDLASEQSVLYRIVRQYHVRSALSVPMIANDEVIGSVVLGETEARRSFTAEEVTLVQVVANSTASAVANALLAEDIETSRTYWQRTFDSIGDMIVVVDPSGAVVRANQALATCLQTTTCALMGEQCERLIPGTGDGVLKQVVSSGQSLDLGIQTIAGEQCAVRAYPLSQASGMADAAVVCAEIVTGEQRLQEEVDRAHRLASVGELLGGTARSFGDLLAAIQGSLLAAFETAGASGSPEEIAAEFDAAMGHIAHGTEIVHRLLSFSRGADSEHGSVSLRQAAQAAVTLCKGHLSAKKRTVTITIAPDTPAVKAQQGPLQEVIFNLVLNALQASEPGGQIRVEAEIHEDKGYADLRIVDDGCGIDSETMEHLFEPFYSTKGGTGLGLSTSAAMVDRMGGSIGVSRAPGAGTTITVRLGLAGANWTAQSQRFAA